MAVTACLIIFMPLLLMPSLSFLKNKKRVYLPPPREISNTPMPRSIILRNPMIAQKLRFLHSEAGYSFFSFSMYFSTLRSSQS
jgi:hypothetical protein